MYLNIEGKAGYVVSVFVLPALPDEYFCILPNKAPTCPQTQGIVSVSSAGEATISRGYPKMSLSKMPTTLQAALTHILLCPQILLYYWANKEAEQKQGNYVT